MIARLERDVDLAAMRRAPVRGGRTAREHHLERIERGAVRARASERDAEVVLGVLVLDEVGERGATVGKLDAKVAELDVAPRRPGDAPARTKDTVARCGRASRRPGEPGARPSASAARPSDAAV